MFTQYMCYVDTRTTIIHHTPLYTTHHHTPHPPPPRHGTPPFPQAPCCSQRPQVPQPHGVCQLDSQSRGELNTVLHFMYCWCTAFVVLVYCWCIAFVVLVYCWCIAFVVLVYCWCIAFVVLVYCWCIAFGVLYLYSTCTTNRFCTYMHTYIQTYTSQPYTHKPTIHTQANHTHTNQPYTHTKNRWVILASVEFLIVTL